MEQRSLDRHASESSSEPHFPFDINALANCAAFVIVSLKVKLNASPCSIQKGLVRQLKSEVTLTGSNLSKAA